VVEAVKRAGDKAAKKTKDEAERKAKDKAAKKTKGKDDGILILYSKRCPRGWCKVAYSRLVTYNTAKAYHITTSPLIYYILY